MRLDPAGFWWAAAPDDQWPEDKESIAEIRSKIVGEHGDRHQELVFIGNAMDESRIRAILEACLLTDLEFVQGPEFWQGLEDPLPAIEMEDTEQFA